MKERRPRHHLLLLQVEPGHPEGIAGVDSDLVCLLLLDGVIRKHLMDSFSETVYGLPR